MRNLKRPLLFFLVLCLLTTALLPALVGCTDPTVDPDKPPVDDPSDPNNPNPGEGNQNATYTVVVKTVGGMPLSGVNVFIYTDDTLGNLQDFATTDASGIATLSLPVSNTYHAVLPSGVPSGYQIATSYPITGNGIEIVLSASVITDEGTPATYRLGDIMRNFTAITTDGQTFNLAETLKTKKAVLINFWFSTCSPCVTEFPYMNSAYERYKEDIEIIALNHHADDTEDVIKLFKGQYGLDIPMAKDYTNLRTAFNITGYPTSILVDRYGTIVLIEVGGLPSEEPFDLMFEHVTAADYEQKIFTDINQLMPVQKPTGTMPSTEEIAGVLGTTGLDITFSGATGSDAEMSWPFIIEEEKMFGRDVIHPSNKNVHNSYSIMNATVTLAAGQALAFDYITSCESGADRLYILVDGKDIYTISGVNKSGNWETCFAFVAETAGTYEISFCYIKDSSTHEADDTVYLSNMRLVDKSEVNVPTYIPRYAATNPILGGGGFENYVDVVLNIEDGYFHVGDANGPLLLVDMLGATQLFSDTTIFYLAYENKVILEGVNYAEQITEYAGYAGNSEIYGLCPVNTELADLLKIIAKAAAPLPHENSWLEMCEYYEAYGTDGKQLADPIRGLAPFCALPAVESTATNKFPNVVTYNRIIVPRGLMYEFIPTKSGAYRITTNTTFAVEGWIFNEDGEIIYVYEGGERMYSDETGMNLSMTYYMEAGTPYYIDICFEDTTQYGSFTFGIEYMGETANIFTIASPGYFTYEEAPDGSMNELVTLGIKVALNPETGYFHEVREDGSFGSILYLDLIGTNNIFGDLSIAGVIANGGFDLTYSDNDEFVLANINYYTKELEKAGKPVTNAAILNELKIVWGENYETYYKEYKVEDVMNGIYHGPGGNYTEEMKAYLAQALPKTDENPELEGCIAVTAELAVILQKLMDKYTFAGAENSFTKICYYYRYLGPAA